MGVDEVLEFADALVFSTIGEHFDDLTREIFRRVWDGKKYEPIAQDLGYDDSYVRHIGSCLFTKLSQALGESVSKSNFKAPLLRRYRADFPPAAVPLAIAASADFMGRERAIADLDQFVSQGAKIIVIQGEGGLGKTTLARKIS